MLKLISAIVALHSMVHIAYGASGTINADRLRFSCCVDATQTFFIWQGLEEIRAHGKEHLYSTSLAQLYIQQAKVGLVQTLKKYPEVERLGRDLARQTFAQPNVLERFGRIDQVLKECRQRPVEVGPVLQAFDDTYLDYVQQALEKKIPGIIVRALPAQAIEQNASLRLTREQTVWYMAAQFAIGLGYTQANFGSAIYCDACRPRHAHLKVYSGTPLEQWLQWKENAAAAISNEDSSASSIEKTAVPVDAQYKTGVFTDGVRFCDLM